MLQTRRASPMGAHRHTHGHRGNITPTNSDDSSAMKPLARPACAITKDTVATEGCAAVTGYDDRWLYCLVSPHFLFCMKIIINKNTSRSNHSRLSENWHHLKVRSVERVNSIFHILCFGLLRGILRISPSEDKWNCPDNKPRQERGNNTP